MRDLNFFELYNKKKDKNLDKDLILYGLAILAIFVMIVYSIINLIMINKLTTEASLLRQQVEMKKSNFEIDKILKTEKEIIEFGEKLEQLRKLDDFVNSQDTINEQLLEEITVRVPETVFLSSMLFNTNLISLEGTSKDKKSISDFEHKLGEIDYFDDVFIPAISYEYELYTFTINIKPKEVGVIGSQDKD